MKKSLIALASTALVSGVAFAEPTVEIYGEADLGVSVYNDYRSEVRNRSETDKNGNKIYHLDELDNVARIGLDPNGLTTSKIGIRAKDDIGNGLTIGVVLEGGFNYDGEGHRFSSSSDFNSPKFTDTVFVSSSDYRRDNSLGFDRKAFISISGDSIGEIRVGRDVTAAYDKADSFGNTSSSAEFEGDWGTTRALLVSYYSPSFNGFSFAMSYALDQDYGALGKDIGGYLAYNGGEALPLEVALTFARAQINRKGELVDGKWLKYANDNNQVDHAAYTASLNASYDFGAAKVSGSIQYYKLGEDIDKNDKANYPIEFDAFEDYNLNGFIGVDIPISEQGKVKLNGSLYKQGISGKIYDEKTKTIRDKHDEEKPLVYKVAIGYEHGLAESTTLYTHAWWKGSTDDEKTTGPFHGVKQDSGREKYPEYLYGLTLGVRYSF